MRREIRRQALAAMAAAVLGAVMAAPLGAAAADGTPMAIKGYDPVAYFTVGAPVRGLADIEYVWDEQRYLFSRTEHRDLFKADPVKYAPQFANYCAMSLTRGKVVEANPEYWLVSDGKLYIFNLPQGPEVFRRALSDNVDKAERNRPLILKR